MRRPLDHDPRRLTRYREDAQLSKAQLARAIGCSRSLITEYENGSRNAPEVKLRAIAAVLGVDVETLRARHRRQSRRAAPQAADGAVPGVRHAERPDGAHEVPGVRGAAVEERP